MGEVHLGHKAIHIRDSMNTFEVAGDLRTLVADLAVDR